MAKCDFLTAEVGTAAGDKIPIEGTYNEENSTFSILLTNQLTVEGAISFQIVGYVTEYDTAEPQIITKSPVVSGFITQSINGVEVEADSRPNLLARIWAKIKEWTDKIHTHENQKTLDNLHCDADEYESPEDGFSIIPGGSASPRLKHRGFKLRYVNDGDVISSVEKTDSEIKINLSADESGLGVPVPKDPIIIPLGVTEEYVTAAINGSLDEIEAMIDESGVLTE